MPKKKSASSNARSGPKKSTSTKPKSKKTPAPVRATIQGDYPDHPRLSTGLYSLDLALADQEYERIGFPIPASVEVYGPRAVGKSTFIYYLSGYIADQLGGSIVLGDFDGFDPTFLESAFGAGGYSGVVQVFTDGTAESIFERLMDYYDEHDSRPVVGIVDSVSSVIPLGEADGDFGARNMGQRAFLMAQLARKGALMRRSRTHPAVIFVSNHAYQQLGWGGTKTAGGDVYPNLATTILQLKRGMREDSWDGSYQVTGRVMKNKHGPLHREFQFFVKSGRGVHPGLSAVIDCIEHGHASCSNKTSVGRVEMGGKKYGWFKNIIEKGDDVEFFKPFTDKLYT